MDHTEAISPTSFRQYATLHAEVWDAIIGSDVTHVVWGKCSIEGIDRGKSIVYVSGYKVAMSYFRDEFFSGLEVLSDLAEVIKAFVKEKEELDRIKYEEDERQKRLQVEEEERLARARIEARQGEQERKYVEAVRMANIREAERQRKFLELKNQEKVVAEYELRKRHEEEERAKSIQEFCKQRGIHWLFHFTRLENLSSILRFGLLGREQLQKLQLQSKPVLNDDMRLDGFPDAVCLSISFPNYKLFHKFSMTNKSDWVVLLLEPYLLWEFDCAFFENNAASSSVKGIPLAKRREYLSLVRMFEDQPSVKRETLGIPDSFPTNPQAEVLVLEPIPPQYITSVQFYDSAAMWHWQKKHNVEPSKRFVANKEYFSPRIDYILWQNPSQKSVSDGEAAGYVEAQR